MANSTLNKLTVYLLSCCFAVAALAAQASTNPADVADRTAIVLDFENGTANKMRKSVRKQLAATFADKLDSEGAFVRVLNEKQARKKKLSGDKASVVVAGVITSYRKKSANVRVLVGVNEGITFFDTRVKLNTKESANSLYKADVDSINYVADELVERARDKGESVRDYVEDTAQLIAKAYRADSKRRLKLRDLHG